MDRERKICIWYEPAKEKSLKRLWREEAAWCWSCPCKPRSKGRNSFNRFSDRVKSTVQYVHPYKRCWRAIALHIWKYHGEVWRYQDV